MQDLAVTTFAQGAVLLGYCTPIIAYIILRKKALRSAPDRPILHLPWWKSIVQYLCAALLAVPIAWLIIIAYLYAALTPTMSRTCMTHMSLSACADAVHSWRIITIVLIHCGILIAIILILLARAESKRTGRAPSPERSYPLLLLTYSHGLLAISWLLCTALKDSLQIFSLVGTGYWVTVSVTIAFASILGYIVGITLWIAAAVRVFFAWLRGEMGGGEGRIHRGGGFVLQDM